MREVSTTILGMLESSGFWGHNPYLSCLSRLSRLSHSSHLSHLSRLSHLLHLSHEIATIILGLLESSGFRKYSTTLVIQLFSQRLCLCHCLCIRLCRCICVPVSFLNSYYYKLSENVWVWGCEIWTSVTIAGRTNNQPNEQTRKDRASQPWTMEG